MRTINAPITFGIGDITSTRDSCLVISETRHSYTQHNSQQPPTPFRTDAFDVNPMASLGAARMPELQPQRRPLPQPQVDVYEAVRPTGAAVAPTSGFPATDSPEMSVLADSSPKSPEPSVAIAPQAAEPPSAEAVAGAEAFTNGTSAPPLENDSVEVPAEVSNPVDTDDARTVCCCNSPQEGIDASKAIAAADDARHAMEEILAATETGRQALATLRANGVPIQFADGSDAYFDGRSLAVGRHKTPLQMALAVVQATPHVEAQAAGRAPDPTKMSKMEYINQMIQLEVEGARRACAFISELNEMAHNTYELDTSPGSEWNHARLAALTCGMPEAEADQIAERIVREMFDSGIFSTSTNGSNYRDHYGSAWNAANAGEIDPAGVVRPNATDGATMADILGSGIESLEEPLALFLEDSSAAKSVVRELKNLFAAGTNLAIGLANLAQGLRKMQSDLFGGMLQALKGVGQIGNGIADHSRALERVLQNAGGIETLGRSAEGLGGQSTVNDGIDRLFDEENSAILRAIGAGLLAAGLAQANPSCRLLGEALASALRGAEELEEKHSAASEVAGGAIDGADALKEEVGDALSRIGDAWGGLEALAEAIAQGLLQALSHPFELLDSQRNAHEAVNHVGTRRIRRAS